MLEWVGSAKRDLLVFPKEVIQAVGYALHLAQIGAMSEHAKPLRGFGGATILEVFEDHDSGTYRAVYTVRFEEAVYVLHCFQKKSTSGIATAKRDIEKVRSRLKLAEEQHRLWLDENKKK